MKYSRISCFLLTLGFAIAGVCKDKRSFFSGHNLTQTTETSKQGVFGIGSYSVSYGVTDETTLASSPWMWSGYNSPNIIFRQRYPIQNGILDEWGLQALYLKSDPSLRGKYIMEVGILWLNIKKILNPYYTLYSSFSWMHLWDETIPFSLRREPFNNQPYQYSVSSLHSLKVSRHFAAGLEFGVLGLNYVYPLVHSGFSLRYESLHFLIQIGASVSAYPYETGRLTNRNQIAPNKADYYDVSVHPEMQVQFYW